ncbi:hypothetical protein FRC04_006706, partial [Tulasnella sp. 424]
EPTPSSIDKNSPPSSSNSVKIHASKLHPPSKSAGSSEPIHSSPHPLPQVLHNPPQGAALAESRE